MQIPGPLTGAACLLFHEGRLVLEVRKTHKWQRRDDGTLEIGVGAIGGTIEPGETPVAALRREVREEVGCEVDLRSATRTVVESPARIDLVDGLVLDGLCPAMIWEVTDPTYRVGAGVAVLRGHALADPRPGDLPAILRVTPDWMARLPDAGWTVTDAVAAGAEVRSRVDLPGDAVLTPANTLKRLLRLRATHPQACARLLDSGGG